LETEFKKKKKTWIHLTAVYKRCTLDYKDKKRVKLKQQKKRGWQSGSSEFIPQSHQKKRKDRFLYSMRTVTKGELGQLCFCTMKYNKIFLKGDKRHYILL
jgi:hypothetical protein